MKKLLMLLCLTILSLGMKAQVLNSIRSYNTYAFGKIYRVVDMNVSHKTGEGITLDWINRNNKRGGTFAATSFNHTGTSDLRFYLPVTPGYNILRVSPVVGFPTWHTFYVSPYSYTPVPGQMWTRPTKTTIK